MASALQDFVQTTLQIRDQNFRKAQEATRVQLEKSRLSLEQQAAQERVKQLDRDFQMNQNYLSLAQQEAKDRQQKDADLKTHQQALDKLGQDKLTEQRTYHASRTELEYAKASLKAGADRTKLVAGISERLLKSGIIPSASDAEKFAQHLVDMASKNVSLPDISGYDQDGNPVYTPQGQEQQGGQPQLNFPGVTTPQGQQAPLVPNLQTNHLQKPQMTSPQQFMTQQSGLAGQLGIGDLISQVPQITQNKFTKADDAHNMSVDNQARVNATTELLVKRTENFQRSEASKESLRQAQRINLLATAGMTKERQKELEKMFPLIYGEHVQKLALTAAEVAKIKEETARVRERRQDIDAHITNLQDPAYVEQHAGSIKARYDASKAEVQKLTKDVETLYARQSTAFTRTKTPWPDAHSAVALPSLPNGDPNPAYTEWQTAAQPGGMLANTLDSLTQTLKDTQLQLAQAKRETAIYEYSLYKAGKITIPSPDKQIIDEAAVAEQMKELKMQQAEQEQRIKQLNKPPVPQTADHAPPPQAGTDPDVVHGTYQGSPFTITKHKKKKP